MHSKITFSLIRRRNQLLSFLVFLVLTILMFITMITNPWYKIPINWYFIPVLGIISSFLVPAFIGRHYCGQYCPTGFICDSMPAKNRAGAFLKSRLIQKMFLFLFIGIFLVSFLPWNMGLPESMTQTYWHAVLNKLWILWVACPFAIALPLVMIFGLTKGGRTWCNYMCPWGAIGTKLGKGQLSVSDKCTNCNSCSSVCPQPEVLLPALGKGGDVDKNCLLCLRCVDTCPHGAICLKDQKS